MKVLLSILREMADLPSDPSMLAEAMSNLGMAVEDVAEVGRPVAGVVAARVTRLEKHPDAAKVTRVWVDAGDGVERHVWCGATNMKADDIVPLAQPGVTMPDGRVIAKRAILGIESEGMLCSGIELGIPDDTDGLLIMPDGTALGAGVFDVLGIRTDVIFDLDLTRNRPECWGHLGVARDLAAHFGVACAGIGEIANEPTTGRHVGVDIQAQQACGMFSVVAISGIEIGPSPGWMRDRLVNLGMRPINNVVDASNLVMLELNQPNHAYDAAKIDEFRIRLARDRERLITLDGTSRELCAEDLLICDGDDHPVGLAGVMGGLDSEVEDSTTSILLEVAWFEPDGIRHTANRHGLRSEASIRFERGVDPNGARAAVARFLDLMRHTNPSARLDGPISRSEASSLPRRIEISLRTETVRRVLGVDIPAEEIVRLLSAIGFECRDDGAGRRPGEVLAVPPSWRPDCIEEIDLVEEVARHRGYATLGSELARSPRHGHLTSAQLRRRLVRRVMVGAGLDEAMPSPFLAPGDLAKCGLSETSVLRLENPLVSEESILRTSLRPGLLAAMAYNLSHRAPRVALWEIGRVYPPGAGELPDEREWLCVLVAGGGAADAVRIWNELSDALGVGALLDQSKVPAGLHPGRSATLSRGRQVVGHVGEVSPEVLDRLSMPGTVACLEVDLSLVLPEEPKPVQARPINRHPSSDIDLSFELPEDTPAAEVARSLRQGGGPSIVSLDLIDAYRSEGVRRSLTFRVRLQKPDGTLAETEIADLRTRMIEAASKHGVVLRD